MNFPAPTLRANIDEQWKVFKKDQESRCRCFHMPIHPDYQLPARSWISRESSRVASESRGRQAGKALPDRNRTRVSFETTERENA
jgi:hypothetical protein